MRSISLLLRFLIPLIATTFVHPFVFAGNPSPELAKILNEAYSISVNPNRPILESQAMECLEALELMSIDEKIPPHLLAELHLRLSPLGIAEHARMKSLHEAIRYAYTEQLFAEPLKTPIHTSGPISIGYQRYLDWDHLDAHLSKQSFPQSAIRRFGVTLVERLNKNPKESATTIAMIRKWVFDYTAIGRLPFLEMTQELLEGCGNHPLCREIFHKEGFKPSWDIIKNDPTFRITKDFIYQESKDRLKRFLPDDLINDPLFRPWIERLKLRQYDKERYDDAIDFIVKDLKKQILKDPSDFIGPGSQSVERALLQMQVIPKLLEDQQIMRAVKSQLTQSKTLVNPTWIIEGFDHSPDEFSDLLLKYLDVDLIKHYQDRRNLNPKPSLMMQERSFIERYIEAHEKHIRYQNKHHSYFRGAFLELGQNSRFAEQVMESDGFTRIEELIPKQLTSAYDALSAYTVKSANPSLPPRLTITSKILQKDPQIRHHFFYLLKDLTKTIHFPGELEKILKDTVFEHFVMNPDLLSKKVCDKNCQEVLFRTLIFSAPNAPEQNLLQIIVSEQSQKNFLKYGDLASLNPQSRKQLLSYLVDPITFRDREGFNKPREIVFSNFNSLDSNLNRFYKKLSPFLTQEEKQWLADNLIHRVLDRKTSVGPVLDTLVDATASSIKLRNQLKELVRKASFTSDELKKNLGFLHHTLGDDLIPHLKWDPKDLEKLSPKETLELLQVLSKYSQKSLDRIHPETLRAIENQIPKWWPILSKKDQVNLGRKIFRNKNVVNRIAGPCQRSIIRSLTGK